MKYLTVLTLFLSACAGPTKVRVRNCIALDLNYYECDLIEQPQQMPHRGI